MMEGTGGEEREREEGKRGREREGGREQERKRGRGDDWWEGGKAGDGMRGREGRREDHLQHEDLEQQD